MAKCLLNQLTTQTSPLNIIIASYEGSIYQAFVQHGDSETLIWQDDNTPLKTRSIIDMQDQLESLPIEQMFLRHESPYDEMIGQPNRSEANTLLVPLGKQRPNENDIH